MLLSLVSFIIIFTIVVLVHELGHFLAARKAGVKVYEFSIGFPFSPKIITLFRHRETEFTLRLLPLGGFVSFSKAGDEEARDLFGTSSWHRALILSSGALFNIAFAILLLVPTYMIGKHLTITASISASLGTVWSAITGTAVFLVNALTGHGSFDGVAGPVGIALLAGKAASLGFMNAAYFTGVLSLSLGIMNLIPFPALDGGQLVMLFIETVRKKPLSVKTHQAVNAVGFGLFMVLTVYISYRDISRLLV